MSRYLALAVALVSACSGSAMPPASSTTTTTAPVLATPATTKGAPMELTSPAFAHEESIPARFTCDGDDVSPELAISAVPADTVSLVLIMDDPDAPGGTWDHWVVFDIPPTTLIPESVGAIAIAGMNSWRRTGYGGPCPPSGTHRYYFTLLALDGDLGLPEGATKAQVLSAADGHVIAEAVLMGTYNR